MSYYIIIRECRLADIPKVHELVRNAYLSNVLPSFINALTREITLQLMVACAAIFFIFLGVPLKLCFIVIPLVLVFVYLMVYSAFYVKSSELMSKQPLQCWVAEAYQPYFTDHQSKNASYKIINEDYVRFQNIDLGNLSKKIIGTVSVSEYIMLEDSAWLFRLAVDTKFRHKGIGHKLIETVKTWCRDKNYARLLLVISECQESTRQMFVSTGFNMKQMYHKQLFGNILTLRMYQLECDLYYYRPNMI